jgi:hypothetical protein
VKEIAIGEVGYRIVATERDGRWTARAERLVGGARFGPDCAGDSEADAVGRMESWLAWQHEHAAALEDLQRAERAYHRTIAGSAFVSSIEGPSPLEMQKESLDALEAARVRLDEVRGRRPDCA